MPANLNQRIIDKRDIALLAQEFSVPAPEIARLYEAQRVKLQSGARVMKYFKTFAVKNIRNILVRGGTRVTQSPPGVAQTSE